MAYAHKDEKLHNVKYHVDDEFRDLHPTDRAEAFGDLADWAARRRLGREQINNRDGVPDRSEDRQVLDEVKP